jgi:hypothetical protein
MKKRALYMILWMAAAASSCVYPFEPDVKSSAGRNLVIEGDILIGDISTIQLGYMAYLDEDYYELAVPAEVQVESESGKVYQGRNITDANNYVVNLIDATKDDKYRLHVKLDDGREYATAWTTPRRPCVVDEITHELDSTRSQVRFNISLHSDDGEQYFRWYFDEDWEYESLYEAKYLYNPPPKEDFDNGGTDPGYMTKIVRPRDGTHYCWMNDVSHLLLFTTTRDLESNRVTEKNFFRVASQSQKMSLLYAMTVRVESLSKESYDYWNAMKTNSEKVGDLFSPIPSEMRGNIYNVKDSTELVLGYINVSGVAEKRVFVDNSVTGYYVKNPRIPEENWMIPITTDEWPRYYYYKNYLPVSEGEGPEFYWAPKRCVDCRLQGGTKERPSFWPNKHY